MSTPLVSVVLPVYNDERHISEAVESILCQSFSDFEFVIVDDGSTDGTPEFLAGLDDTRLVRLRNEPNQGMVASLQRGIGVARGRFIARMDSNDFAYPERLARQVGRAVGPDAPGVVGCWFESDDDRGERHVLRFPVEDGVMQQRLLYRNCVCHSSALFRRDVWMDAGGYRAKFAPAEDWDLWIRMGERASLTTVPEVLQRCRVQGSGMSVVRRAEQRRGARWLLEEAMERRQAGIGVPPTSETACRHYLFIALEHLAEGDAVACRQALQRAALVPDGRSLMETDIVTAVAERALEVAGAASIESPEAGRGFLRALFDALPDSLHDLGRRARDTRVLYEAGLAFRAHKEGDARLARRSMLRAVAGSPRLLGNRGVIAVLVRSLTCIAP